MIEIGLKTSLIVKDINVLFHFQMFNILFFMGKQIRKRLIILSLLLFFFLRNRYRTFFLILLLKKDLKKSKTMSRPYSKNTEK